MPSDQAEMREGEEGEFAAAEARGKQAEGDASRSSEPARAPLEWGAGCFPSEAKPARRSRSIGGAGGWRKVY